MKKLTAIILSIIMVFSFTAVPATAAAEDSGVAVVAEEVNIIEQIINFLHEFIAGVFEMLGLDCPFCEAHGEDFSDAGAEDVAVMYNNAINNLKNYQKSVKMEKRSTVDLEIANCPGGDTVRSIVEEVIKSFEGTTTDEQYYILGENTNGKLSNQIPPAEKEAYLTASAAQSITLSEKNGKQIIRVKLKDGKGTYDGTTTVDPQGYAGVIDTLNLGALDIGPMAMRNAEILYSGVVIEAVLDSEGRVVSLETNMPFAFEGTAQMAVISATLGITGYIKEVYKFTH